MIKVGDERVVVITSSPPSARRARKGPYLLTTMPKLVSNAYWGIWVINADRSCMLDSICVVRCVSTTDECRIPSVWEIVTNE